MSEENIEEKLKAALPQLANLSAVVKFDLGDAGQWLIDGRLSTPLLSQEDADAECTILISADNLTKLLDGRLDPMLAYTLGKIKVRGSMGVAMKLVSAIG
ncbi:SCP2 sterol-binding domain-containing protein [Telmatospirillum sp.]|uniref:SCP2 sterol-binding domain-containing protein n=1 Tax=Telmatospirillum sp. TaxID=2079197 RepID=UPI00284DFA39|nr:SCP2 sterol-binding domain-containing protein [Telmatospirillum sp.]MDR3436131.1 SCP2 sterol-binding domain-containing protein [Telmatospirillum sp.]